MDVFSQTLVQGLKEAGINFVAGLPDEWLGGSLQMIMDDPHFIGVPVVNEAHGVAACAGAWLGW